MQDTYHFCHDRKVLFCIRCKKGINPDQVTRHLTDKHADIDKADRVRLAAVEKGDAIVPGDKVGLAKAESFGYVPWLEISEAAGCTVEGCSWVGGVNRWKTHQRLKHPGVLQGGARMISAQSIFGAPHIRLFEVVIPAGTQVVQEEDVLEQVIQGYLSDKKRDALTVPPAINEAQWTKWDHKTKWASFHAGRRMDDLAQRAERSGGAQEPLMDHVSAAIRYGVELWHERLGVLSEHVRRIFGSVNTELSTKPMAQVRKETLVRYGQVWQRLLGFLMASLGGEEMAGLCLTTGQVQQLTALRDRAAGWTSGTAAGELWPGVLEVSIGLINQVVTGDPFGSPIIYWVSVDGYHMKHRRWKMASETRPTLSALVYCVRLFSIAEWARLEPEAGSDRARAYATAHLYDGADTMLTTIHSLRAYAKTAATDYYATPTITWRKDGAAVSYKAEWVDLADLRAGVMATVARLEQLLLDQLLFRSAGILDRCAPSLFVDDPAWSTMGESFANLQGTGVVEWWKGVVEGTRDRVEAAALLQEMREGGSGQRQVFVHRHKWIRHYAEGLELLMVLMYLTGGLLARGTELTNLRWANAWTGQRNVFLFGEDVAMVSTYNKIDALKGAPTVIARFLPHRVGRLLVAWIVHVLPFWDVIQATLAKEDRRAPSSLLFHDQGIPWETTRLSDILGELTKEHCGVRLTVQGMRQVMIAIDQKKMRRSATTGIDAHILQSGHGEEVEEHHYALQADALVGLTQDSLEVFRDVSYRWHRFWGFVAATDEGPASAPRSPRQEGDLRVIARDCQRLLAKVDELSAGLSIKVGNGEGDVSILIDKPAPQTDDSIAATDDSIAAGLQELYETGEWRSLAQRQAVEVIAKTHRSCLFICATGGGKTLAYTIPAHLSHGMITLVVVPFTALREEVVRGCVQRGIAAARLTATSTPHTSVVVCVPEATILPSFQAWAIRMVGARRLRRIVFDECHHFIVDKTWRTSWAALSDLFSRPDFVGLQKVFLSATLPPQVKEALYREMKVKSRDVEEVVAPTVRHNIRHQVVTVESSDGYIRHLKQELAARGAARKTLIFVMTIERGRALTEELQIGFYHGRLPDDEKEALIDEFTQGARTALVATSALAEGVNLNVDEVFMVGGTFGLIDYCQQAGRVGRLGEHAPATTIVSRDDMSRLRRNMSQEGRAMTLFLETTECRRRVLAAYMDGHLQVSCEDDTAKCDNCSGARPRGQPLGQAIAGDPAPPLAWAWQRSPHARSPHLVSSHALTEVTHISATTYDASPKSSLNRDGVPVLTHVSDTTAEGSPWEGSEASTSRKRKRDGDDGLDAHVVHRRKEATVEVLGLWIPHTLLDVGRAPDLKVFLEDGASLALILDCATQLRQMAEMQSCLACWLQGHGDRVNHTWTQCPRSGLGLGGKERFKAGIKAAGLPKMKLHYTCLLPITFPIHKKSFSFQGSCGWNDEVKDLLVVGLQLEAVQFVFRAYDIQSFDLEGREVFRELVRPRTDPCRVNLVMIWLQLVVWRIGNDQLDGLD